MAILDLLRLDNRVALVTGANRGIGSALAVALAEAGADIALASREGNAHDTAQRVEALGRRSVQLARDLAESEVAGALVGETVDQLGRVDILVNNAGMITRAPALEYEQGDWQRVLDVNLTALFVLCQAAARRMAAQGGGKIVNVASVLAFQGGIRVPAYAAAKHGVVGLTQALANEWAPLGINVNAIAPGYIATDNNRALRDDPVRYRQILDRIPAGRWGTPDDLAGAAVFLASPAAAYLHGATLTVDGGWLAR